MTIVIVVAFSMALGTLIAVAWIRHEIAGNLATITASHKSKTAYSAKDQRLFDAALKQLDVEEVRRLLESGAADPNGIHSDQETTPLYRLISENLEKPEVLAILQILLDMPTIEPNGDFRSWTPLKMAVSKKMTQVVKLLLAHPKTIPEVHVTGLACSAQRELDPSIHVIVPQQADKCWTTHPRRISESSSKLMKASTHKLGGQKSESSATQQRPKQNTASSAATSSSSSSSSPYNPKNPFQDPPPGVMPPRDAFIMNPKAFPNIAEALFYYFLGDSFSSPLVWCAIISLCAGHFAVVMFVSWTVICATEEHEQRHPRQQPPQPQPQPQPEPQPNLGE